MSSANESSSPSPVAPNAPKFGTLVPNRIFVGGISSSTTEAELQALFSNYGCVKAAKIISDRAGVSKGYGFVTFETEEEARRIQEEAENIVLKDRKLNIAPAIKKQPFARVYSSAQVIPNGTVMYHNGVPYTYHNGMAFFTPPDGASYQYPQTQILQSATLENKTRRHDMDHSIQAAAAAYPVVYPQAVFLPPHYQYHAAVQLPWSSGGPWPSPSVPAHYVYAALPPSSSSSVSTSDVYHYTAATSGSINQTSTQPITYLAPSTPDYSEGGHNESSTPEGSKTSRKGNISVYESPHKSYSLRGQRGSGMAAGGSISGGGDTSRTVKQIQGQQPHLVAKTVNGVTVMAYTTPIMVTAASLTPQSKDHSGNVPLTPPHTPIGADTCDVMRKLQGLAM